MTKNGKVIEVTDSCECIVEISRMSACDMCHKSAEGCALCNLGGGGKKTKVRAKNNIGADVGDRVVISASTSWVMLCAALVFVFPIVLSLVCYFIVSTFFEGFIVSLSPSLAFLFSFFIVWVTVGRSAKKDNHIELSEIIRDNSDGFSGT